MTSKPSSLRPFNLTSSLEKQAKAIISRQLNDATVERALARGFHTGCVDVTINLTSADDAEILKGTQAFHDFAQKVLERSGGLCEGVTLLTETTSSPTTKKTGIVFIQHDKRHVSPVSKDRYMGTHGRHVWSTVTSDTPTPPPLKFSVTRHP